MSSSEDSSLIASVIVFANWISTKYYYDFTERLMKYVETGEDYSHSVAYTYDLMNNLTGVVETINGTEFTSTYGYNDDNVLTSLTNGSDSWTFGYDDYGRLNAINSAPFDRTYNYKSVSNTKLTAQLASVAYPSLSADQTYAYTYDDNGNIASVTFGGYTYSYVYDSQNQLIRENNSRLGRTYTWTYDNAGNITSRTTYAYTTGALGTPTAVLNYRYEDPDWGDLLTGINNNTITYDEIGNMLTFGACSFTWEHGRQLASQTINGTTWTYTYNADGMRTGRTNGTNTYEYVYNGSQLMQMTRNGVVMDFTYINGIPATISYGGNTFYYVVNGQGDITGITDSQGIIQVTYYYDAWGATTSIYNPDSPYGLTLATINPLRYRGYVFDWETGLYYLQSRYYIPEIGRFLNADSSIGINEDFNTYNLFVYCGNNPVDRYDVGGMSWKSVWKAVKKAVSTVLHGGNNAAQKIGIDTAAVGGYLLNMTKDSKGIYHASFNCWQQYFGYNDMYDFMFDIGTSMKGEKFAFTYNGQSYIFWLWKGDYINLGAGAEIGIYYGGEPHWRVDKTLAMSMKMTVRYKGQTIIDYCSYTWWLTGFNPKYQNVGAGSLRVTFSIYFRDYGMYCAFQKNSSRLDVLPRYYVGYLYILGG